MSDRSLEMVPAVQPPRRFIRWPALALSGFCWLGVAFSAVMGAMHVLSLLPDSMASTGPAPATTLFRLGVGMADPIADAEVMKGLRADLASRIVGLVPSALFIWALLSARRSFVGVARGEYFARSTILGLRNLSLAVLLHQTVSPVVVGIATVLYVMRVKGDRTAEISMSLGLNEAIALILIFAAVVALVSSVMVHAAKLADENRQFV